MQFYRHLFLVLVTATQCSSAAEPSPQGDNSRSQVVDMVIQVRRSDYEGDRSAMKREFDALGSFVNDKSLGARVRYWRGFAMWRRAINGFNDAVDRKELEQDLNDALTEFKAIGKEDVGYLESRIAIVSCTGYLMFMHGQEPEKASELLGQLMPVAKEVKEAAPDNPRWLWVSGPISWSTPPERGGSQDKAFATYEKGLEIVRRTKPASDPLEQAWGEPELLMNVAWSYLNRTVPDLDAAERNAREALKLVPHWHYVRDILVAQIAKAKTGG